MFQWSTRNILNFVTFAASVPLTCIMISWFVAFHYLRTVNAISGRRPLTSLLIGLFCIIGTFISHNINLIFINITEIRYIPFTNLLVYTVVCISTSGTYHVITYRAWMLYYDINWNKAMEDSKWRLFIDPEETNWFLKNKSKYASPKRTTMILFVDWLFWFLCGCASIIYGGPNQPRNTLSKLTIGSTGCIMLLMMIINIFLFYKMPALNDIYYIRDEMTVLLRFEILFLTSFFTITLILDATPYTSEYVILAICGILSSFSITCITFYYVLRRLKLPANPFHAKLYVKSQKATNNIYYIDKNSPSKTLKQIVRDDNGFNLFARHLTKEFCLENLLFFVETQQWLNSLKKSHSVVDNQSELLTIKFTDTAPKSRIIAQTQSQSDNCIKTDIEQMDNYPTTEEYLQCISIFKKYIANDAYFCINIDSAARLELYNVFGCNMNYASNRNNENLMIEALQNTSGIDVNKLFHLFDASRTQIYQLLLFAFARFKRTDEYKSLISSMEI
eukprot:131423_1